MTPVHGIGTLGHYTDRCWVTHYKVKVSLDDGETFSTLKENNTNKDQVSIYSI